MTSSTTSEIPVLDHGFVRLDGALADDLSVINSARVSFATRGKLHDYDCESIEGGDCTCHPHKHTIGHEKQLSKKDKGLISFLMKNRHGTPFEHNIFRFHVKAPIFVFREWQRHRISSYNEWSARYAKLEREFYIPEPEHVRSQVGRPGAYTFEPLDEGTANTFRLELEEFQKRDFNAYLWAIDNGVAKEQARLFLPVSIYSQMYYTTNARSLMNFLSLRNSEHAMWEIKEYAKVVELIFQDLMPITAEAFVKNDRVAP